MAVMVVDPNPKSDAKKIIKIIKPIGGDLRELHACLFTRDFKLPNGPMKTAKCLHLTMILKFFIEMDVQQQNQSSKHHL